MEKNEKKKKRKQQVNEDLISLISSPSAWTKEMEDLWLSQPGSELRRRFPPMSKPRHIKYTQGKKA